MEIWKDWNNYKVSNMGVILRNNKEVKNKSNTICFKGKKYRVPSIVAELFIGPRPINNIIVHLDWNKYNNNVLNLKYVTIEEMNELITKDFDYLYERKNGKKRILPTKPIKHMN
jgi:hypothetical protein